MGIKKCHILCGYDKRELNMGIYSYDIVILGDQWEYDITQWGYDMTSVTLCSCFQKSGYPKMDGL